jgi:hypothetical protein
MRKPGKVTYIDLRTGKKREIIPIRTLWKMTVTRRNHVEDGRNAWDRLKHSGSQNYNDWMQVAEALDIGQRECMRLAEIDRPQGSRYRKIFGEWLRQYQLDDMNKADRFLALEILEHRPEIEKWRASLPLDVRIALNHPRAIWRRFKAAQQPNPEETT